MQGSVACLVLGTLCCRTLLTQHLRYGFLFLLGLCLVRRCRIRLVIGCRQGFGITAILRTVGLLLYGFLCRSTAIGIVGTAAIAGRRLVILIVIIVVLLLLHHEYAQLIERVQRQGNSHKGERIAGRSDDGSHNDNDDKRMTAILAQRVACDDAQQREYPRDKRKLERQTHTEHQRHEVVDIGIQGDEDFYVRAEVVGRQEAQRHGIDHEIAHGNAYVEHHRTEKQGFLDTARLIDIERGAYEQPYLP